MCLAAAAAAAAGCCRLLYVLNVMCLTNAVLVAVALVSKFSKHKDSLITCPQFLHAALYDIMAAVQLAVLLLNQQLYMSHRFKVRPEPRRIERGADDQRETCACACRWAGVYRGEADTTMTCVTCWNMLAVNINQHQHTCVMTCLGCR
jgi:hypothetical protein